jgi:hypothetical protein
MTHRSRKLTIPSFFVDISSRDSSQVGAGLVLTYVPSVDEVPATTSFAVH